MTTDTTKDIVPEEEVDASTAELRRTIGVLRARLTQSQEEVVSLSAVIERHQVWKNKLIKDLHIEAEDRDLCGDFDDFMVNHGMPPRPRGAEDDDGY